MCVSHLRGTGLLGSIKFSEDAGDIGTNKSLDGLRMRVETKLNAQLWPSGVQNITHASVSTSQHLHFHGQGTKSLPLQDK